jgi:hypothetical protein
MTTRFARVVEACGQPEVTVLWTKPRQDKRFMAAVAQRRIMTIKQETVGTKKDFGRVGFFQEKNVSYLIFPKPLKSFEKQRIIGINYDLVKSPKEIGPPIASVPKRQTRFRRRIKPAGVWPELPSAPAAKGVRKRFSVTLRFTASVDVTEEIEADSRNAAKAQANSLASTPDFSRGTITRKVLKVATVP